MSAPLAHGARLAAISPAQAPNPCPICGSVDGSPRFRVDGALIVRCPQCALVRQATRPLALDRLYDPAYFETERAKGGYANYFLDAPVNARTFRRRLQDIERRYGSRGRLLDVGCALGDVVLEATRRGWRAEGVEISRYAVERARERGAVAHLGPIERLALPPSSVDVVTLYDTIEHLGDPVGSLRVVRDVLVPRGLVHIVTPNVGSLQAALLGRAWYHYKPGEHLYYFSPRTLRAAIEAAGLDWEGAHANAAYVTPAFVANRLRYYAPRLFGALERALRGTPLGEHAFLLPVGEMEAWARKR